MFFDSHAHIDLADYGKEREAVARRALDKGVFFVDVGTDIETSREAIAFASGYPKGVYAAVGCHPSHVSEKKRQKEFDFQEYEELAGQEKVVAIGEVGLDYSRLSEDANTEKLEDEQKNILAGFVKISQNAGISLILHCRGRANEPFSVYDDVLKIVTGAGAKRGVIHCFGGTLEQAKKFIGAGFFVGITGIITFKKSVGLRDIVAALPLESILIETDSPYLSPEPYRGKKNEPSFVPLVAQAIADIKNIPLAKVAETTFGNAIDLFGIKGYD